MRASGRNAGMHRRLTKMQNGGMWWRWRVMVMDAFASIMHMCPYAPLTEAGVVQESIIGTHSASVHVYA